MIQLAVQQLNLLGRPCGAGWVNKEDTLASA